MNERELIEKLRRVEALFAGGATPGERAAAGKAKARIEARLEELERSDPPVEFRFNLQNRWSRRLFMALLRRYGLEPYRYYRQRRSTVMVRVSKRFCNEVLWPEYEELNSTLTTYLDDVADRVIGEVVHTNAEEARVVDESRQLVAR